MAGAEGREPLIASLASIGSVLEEIELGMKASLRQLAGVVLEEMWEQEVGELCGPRWRPVAERRAARAGGCATEVTLAGQSVALRRPRVRVSRRSELELASYHMAGSRDLLAGDALESILVVASGGFTPELDTRDTLVERFVELMVNRLAGLIWQPLWDPGPLLVIGELRLRRYSLLAWTDLDAAGNRSLIGLRPGASENEVVVDGLVRELAGRLGHRVAEVGILAGEEPGIQRVLKRRFPSEVPIQRCAIEKMRRVIGLLEPGLQPVALDWLQSAYHQEDVGRALADLQHIAAQLDAESPEASAALREGLEDTLTARMLAGRRAKKLVRGEGARAGATP